MKTLQIALIAALLTAGVTVTKATASFGWLTIHTPCSGQEKSIAVSANVLYVACPGGLYYHDVP